jgi:hypothetical protein
VQKPFVHTPEEALRACVDALGGLQVVGHYLRVDLDPVIAGQWLSHCLTPTCRDKLSLSQILWIFRQAKLKGAHDGAELWNDLLGYHITAVVDPAEEIADMLRKAQQANRESAELTEEAIARARAQGLKIE